MSSYNTKRTSKSSKHSYKTTKRHGASEHGSRLKKQRSGSPEARTDDRSDPTKRALKIPKQWEEWETWLVFARGKFEANEIWEFLEGTRNAPDITRLLGDQAAQTAIYGRPVVAADVQALGDTTKINLMRDLQKLLDKEELLKKSAWLCILDMTEGEGHKREVIAPYIPAQDYRGAWLAIKNHFEATNTREK